ncbi:MAG: ATP-binding cassette domain-containing protein, partial [Lutispora sp.]
MGDKILEVKDLTKYFEVSSGLFGKKKYVHAVEKVSFDLYKSETLGIVGESGSGKSTLGRVLLKLIKQT